MLVATVAQLAVGALSDLPQSAGKGFGARLVAYPLGDEVLGTLGALVAGLVLARLRPPDARPGLER